MRLYTRLPANSKSIGLLMIEQGNDGVFLISYVDGRSMWDSWHRSVEDAKHQAEYEHPGVTMVWGTVPETIDDVATLLR